MFEPEVAVADRFLGVVGFVVSLNIAETVTSELIVRLHFWGFLESAVQFSQMLKANPLAGMAVRLTVLPGSNCCAQSFPQEIPTPLTTPRPEFATVSFGEIDISAAME